MIEPLWAVVIAVVKHTISDDFGRCTRIISTHVIQSHKKSCTGKFLPFPTNLDHVAQKCFDIFIFYQRYPLTLLVCCQNWTKWVKSIIFMLFIKTLTGERIQDFEHSNLRYIWTYAFRNWDYICCFSRHSTYKVLVQ